jgi:hypothetical protein
MTSVNVNAAAMFIAASARVLDRRRFDRLIGDGEARPVRDAIAAYRNADGGFGHGLEPDLRTPASQPAAVAHALRTLDECDAWDDGLAAGACDWLATVAAAAGGVAFAVGSIDGGAHAPWWEVPEGNPASPIGTGTIAGTLHARGMSHPWLDRATEVMWDLTAGLDGSAGAYDMYGVLAFLQSVPDRDRAAAAFGRVGDLILENKMAALDPREPGETHSPLDFAPRPDSIARAIFDDAVIEAHLDHLAGSQLDDGGWMFNWLAWSPAAERDWRGSITVDKLALLRANGRL